MHIRCQLFLKLFLVMGTAWIFQLMHAFIDPKESKWYWVLLDMTNLFQAVAIFVIFVCKRETVRSLEHKYPIFKGKLIMYLQYVFFKFFL